MLSIAKSLNILIAKSTIHRWANEPDFPLVAGLDGRMLLYSKIDCVMFLKRRLKRIQEER